MSKWQTIIDNVKSTLQEITITNGYNTDVGNNVYVWRVAAITDDTPLPFIDIRDNNLSTSYESSGYPQRHHVLSLDINVVANSSTVIRDAIEDILDAINNNDEAFGMPDGSTDLTNISIEAYQEEMRLLVATMSLEIKYKSHRWAI